MLWVMFSVLAQESKSAGEGSGGWVRRQGVTVLVVDDDPPICRLLRRVIEGIGWRVAEADSGQLAISQAAFARPDGIVLDLGLPDIDGADVIRRIREWTRVPILVLSVRQEPEEMARILDLGADDFLCKPFNTDELLARLRSLIRRADMHAGAPEVVLGPLRLDCVAHRVEVHGREVRLTPTEYALLKVLAGNRGKVVTQTQILRAIWGPNGEQYRNPLRVHMAHLRRKMAEHGMPKSWLRTELGVGYRLMG